MEKLTEQKFRTMMATDGAVRLTPDQFSWLTPDQIRGLTPAQIATHKKIWDSVPVVDHLYSSILADIKAEKIILDQRTYGPDDATPTMNICGTPMCIAGHTVNRGGSAGYALKEKYGFPTAAALIHAKSRPDVSKPRYDSCPTEWTLAYRKSDSRRPDYRSEWKRLQIVFRSIIRKRYASYAGRF